VHVKNAAEQFFKIKKAYGKAKCYFARVALQTQILATEKKKMKGVLYESGVGNGRAKKKNRKLS
jgi:hypothetical protein